MVPKSAEGRAFTVMYALFGIPLQMVALAVIGRLLSRALDCCIFRPCGFSEDEDRNTWSISRHLVRVGVSAGLFLALFAFIPAAIFQRLENWTFGESVYYALITLTTIGYGDYEAGCRYIIVVVVVTSNNKLVRTSVILF